jgi:formylglycine-generating enzyme required for sulfatase activity
MPQLPDSDVSAQRALLERLHKQGRLSDEDYRAALAELSVDRAAAPASHIEKQFNIAGDYVDKRATPEPGASPDTFRRAYLHRLAQQASRLPLVGINPKAASDQKSGELKLSAVYTALLTQRPDIDEDMRGLRPERAMEREARRLSALEVLDREKRLVLLGDPGSGKSTFVNFVALCLAGEVLGFVDANLAVLTAPLPVEERQQRDEKPKPQPWRHGALLPARIVLRDLAARGLPDPGKPVGGDTLWNFIVAELGETLKDYVPHLKRELMEHGGLILLDGLDEVPDAHRRREQVKQVAQDFADRFPRCRFLVTSRTYAYQRQDWKLDGFAEVVLSPFAPGQIERFVDNWYAHIGAVRDLAPQDTQARAALLKAAIQHNPRLAELATRPLLLTLMASLHAWRGGSLPEKREELYADAVDLLLDQWESPKVVYDVDGQPQRQPSLAEWLKADRAVVRAELNRLAFEAHRDQPKLEGTADVDQGRLVSALIGVAGNPELNPTRLVEYIRDRAGLLAARGEGVYTYPHRTFQEYLAACHLTDHGFPDELANLLRADPNRWREVTLLAGAKASRGTSSAVWNLADALCYRDAPVGQDVILPKADAWGALLAAQTLIENEGARLAQAGERNAPKRERVRLWLKAIVMRGWLPPVDRAQAGEALAALGDDRNFDELVEVDAGSFLMGDDNDDAAKPQHRLTLPAFKIGKYQVTNTQYLHFVEATGRDWQSPERNSVERGNCPARWVSWHDARAYCEWLTKVWRAEGKIGPREVVRLPTEAEWEKAARGSLPSPATGGGGAGGGGIYPWGDDWDANKCNASETGIGDTCVVGMFPTGESPYHCLDMAGNVWEWTISLWGKDFSAPSFKYPYKVGDKREDLKAGDDVLRVIRGGSFDFRRGCRCAFRGRGYPLDDWNNLGFRVVVSPISPASAL